MASPATLNADSLEQQFYEIARLLIAKQTVTAKNPNGVNVITSMSVNELTGVLTLTASIPTTATIDATDGSVDRTATAVYLD